jgi:hypothetical protein
MVLKSPELLDGIMNATPLNLKPDSATAPMIRLTHQLIKDAIKLKAEAIRLELDMELHLKVQEEMQKLHEKTMAVVEKRSEAVDEMLFKIGRLPNAFGVTYTINGVENQMTPANGELFGNVIRILLLAVGIPVWTKGEISAPLETINPASNWMLESKDLSRRVELRRIRATS